MLIRPLHRLYLMPCDFFVFPKFKKPEIKWFPLISMNNYIYQVRINKPIIFNPLKFKYFIHLLLNAVIFS